MNIIDILILIPILYGLIRGLIKGLVHELTSLVALVLGVVGARMWAPTLKVQLLEMIDMDPTVAQVISYCLVFFAIALSLNLLGRLVSKLLSAVSLGGVNKLLGAVFGAVKLALIVSVVINLVEFVDVQVNFIKDETKQSSVCYEPIKRLAAVAWEQVKND